MFLPRQGEELSREVACASRAMLACSLRWLAEDMERVCRWLGLPERPAAEVSALIPDASWSDLARLVWDLSDEVFALCAAHRGRVAVVHPDPFCAVTVVASA